MGLDTVEFVMWAEDEFGMDIPDDDAANILTVGEFCKYLAERLPLKDGVPAPSYMQIFEKVAGRLESEFGVARERITEGARFVKDLGLD